MLQSSDFINASAYVRVLEKRLLSDSGLGRALDAPNAQDALRMLSQNSDYNFSSLARVEDYEGILKAELQRVYKIAYGLTKHTDVVDVLACKYDYHNVKVALKTAYHGSRTEPPYFHITPVDPDEITAVVNARGDAANKSSLPMHLIAAIAAGKESFQKTQSPQSIDICLDKHMFAHMLQLSDVLGNEFITTHVRSAIDLYNVKALLRIKNMQKSSAFLSESLVPGGLTDTGFFLANYSKPPSAMVPVFFYKSFGSAMKKGVEAFERTGNFSGLERLFDNYLVEQTKQVKYITYGAEILFAYLFSKENEIRQIRIVVTGKTNGISAEILKERLRGNYA